MTAACEKQAAKFNEIFFNSNAINIYGWLDYVVTLFQPFSCVENETVRQYCRLKPIGRACLMKYFRLIGEKVQENIGPKMFINLF